MSEARQCRSNTGLFSSLVQTAMHGATWSETQPRPLGHLQSFSPSRPDLRWTVNAGEGGLRATEGEKTQTEAAQEETSRGSQIHLRPALSLLILSQDTSPPIKTGNHRIALHQILVRYHQKRSVSIGEMVIASFM